MLLQVQRRAGVRARDDDGDLIVGGFSDVAGALLARNLNAAAAGRATGDEVDAARCEMMRFIAASRCWERERGSDDLKRSIAASPAREVSVASFHSSSLLSLLSRVAARLSDRRA